VVSSGHPKYFLVHKGDVCRFGTTDEYVRECKVLQHLLLCIIIYLEGLRILNQFNRR